MRILLDTNRYSDAIRGEREATVIIERATQIYIPFAVLAELKYAFALGARRTANEQRLAEFLASPKVSLLMPDTETCEQFAALYVELRKKGRPMDANDLWIAALALQHDLHLFTRDADFDNLPQVRRVPLP